MSDSSPLPEAGGDGRRYRIGYAMAPKKVSTVVRDSLIDLAAGRGIDLVAIETDKPLLQQAPFDCVLHKLYGQEWRTQLLEFSAAYPAVPVVDPLDRIEKLHNRVTMLQVFDDENFSISPTLPCSESIGIPRQIFVQNSDSVPLSDRIAAEGLKFPVIAKPMLANGTDGSHQMSLIFNHDGLNELQPPFVLQEFVNHGGVVFKIYVAGDHTRCVKRRSLPDISAEKMGSSETNLLPFSQVSNLTDEDQSDEGVSTLIEETQMPPPEFVAEMAKAMRTALKLHLFNFDLIRDGGDAKRYLVIDINYFPGYAKIPSYETMLTDFLLDIVQRKKSTDSSNLETASTDDQEPAA